jgi:membrane protease YdiL (CAAX protease family)
MSMVCRLVLAILLCLPSLGWAADRPELIATLGLAPDRNELLGQVKEGARKAYEQALQSYDELIKARPYDVFLQIERCRFIRESVGDDDEGNYSEDICAQSQECNAQIEENFRGHPEADLYKLESLYGDEGYKAALALEDSAQQTWTDGQRARLYVVLAHTGRQKHPTEANRYAMTALKWDESSDVRLMAAQHWKEQGAVDRAIEVLTSPLDGHSRQDPWYLTEKLQVLAELHAQSAVREIHERLRQFKNYNHLEVAKGLASVGAFEEARAELDLSGVGASKAEIAWERFRLEWEVGTPQQALAAYQKLRDLGFKQDPLGLNRAALFLRSPTLSIRARDFLGLFTLLITLVGVALALLIPLSFVHYRGLARQVAGKTSFGSTLWRDRVIRGWNLRDAWLVLFAFTAASILAVYAAGPVQSAGPTGSFALDLTTEQQARIALWESFISLLFMIAIAAWGRRYGADNAIPRWSFTRSMVIAVVWALVLRIPLLLTALTGRAQTASPRIQVELWTVLQHITTQNGKLAALWMLALAAPVIEEFMFRGVVLTATSRHISFGWANVFQAALFAAAHFDLRAAPVLFAFGLLLGWIRRRSGALWAPMLSHGLFNLVGGLILLR